MSVASFAFGLLAAFAVVTTTALGALFLHLCAVLGRARWFVPLRRPAEALAGALPACALLFVPVVLARPILFPEADEWMYTTPFAIRGAIELLSFIVAAEALCRAPKAKKALVAAPAIVVLGITSSLAAFDWIMALEGRWVSTVFGLYVGVGAYVGGVAAVALMLARRRPAEVGPDHAHALGRLLFAGVCLWGYLAFCQYLLIWIADLPREVGFFVRREAGAWLYVSYALAIGHFILPFLALLSRPLKRSWRGLAFVAAWLLAFHVLDVAWMVLPVGPRGTVLAFVIALAFAALVVGAVTALRARSIPLLPERDPELEEGLEYQSP